jgi:hypothetical protein
MRKYRKLYDDLTPEQQIEMLIEIAKRREALQDAPLYERTQAHWVLAHDRRLTWFERIETALGIEPPHSKRTWRIHITAMVATVQVLIIVLATATVHPENLLLIPTFCLYVAAMLAMRQYRINSMPSLG